jgi:hypothetical protein
MLYSLKRSFAVLLVLVLSTALLSACGTSAAQNPTPVLDERLFGQWSNQADPSAIDVNAAGEPVGTVSIGIWFIFRENGSYVQVANHMTFAIGGVAVEEGRYAVEGDRLLLSNRTWSFFPFEGSPQKKQYRTAQADAKLTFRFAEEDGVRILYLAETNTAEVLFRSVR